MTAPVQPPTDDDKRSALELWKAAQFASKDKSHANAFAAESKFLRDQAPPTNQPKVRK